MKIDFVRYLDAKYDLDLRSMHRATRDCFFSHLGKQTQSARILEIGGGIGSMLTYMVEANAKNNHDYTLVDAAVENIAFVPGNLEKRTAVKGFQFKNAGNQQYQIINGGATWQLETICSTTEKFLNDRAETPEFDIVVASSYLDIVPVPETLRLLDRVVKKTACLYLPFNYDGLTFFHPNIDRHLDEEIVRLYNKSMDDRILDGNQTGGSLTGRKLFDWLPQAGYEIVSAGSSDWIVSPKNNVYAGEENYFLECILQFVQDSVSPQWTDVPEDLNNWLKIRRGQISEGKLTFLAHQIDFMALRGAKG